MSLNDPILALLLVAGMAILIQLGLIVSMALALRAAAREQAKLHTEVFGLVRKLEGLTLSRREQVIKHYNRILETLSAQLPTTVAARAGQVIFDTESRMLEQLAELEPNLNANESSKRKLDELILSMERLEQTLVSLTAETVQKVMVEGRRSLLESDQFDDSMAA
ncbi:MAG: hypothetical protein QY326_02725 [Bdellovibrionota bacterium]|nr:MAG: hypothetical protein QY326_02725 [Bdellovibrionota bacterium]